MDTKNLIKQVVPELVEKIENENKDKNIIFIDSLEDFEDLIIQENKDGLDNLLVLLCRDRDNNDNVPDTMIKVIDKKNQITAFSKNFITEFANKEHLFLYFAVNPTIGFSLAVLSLAENAIENTESDLDIEDIEEPLEVNEDDNIDSNNLNENTEPEEVEHLEQN